MLHVKTTMVHTLAHATKDSLETVLTVQTSTNVRTNLVVHLSIAQIPMARTFVHLVHQVTLEMEIHVQVSYIRNVYDIF